MTASDILFTPIKIGDIQLKHRIALAPLTRSRSPGELANTLNSEYYSQRATPGGLLISEGTTSNATGIGYADVPAIRTSEQARAWKLSTDAVHARGGYIFAQLWHVGRVSKSEFQPEGKLPVSASDLPAPGKEAPRPLSVAEIEEIVAEYKASAKLAVTEAGFDGVEIHGAHGYLIDQFLESSSNKRTDAYGGSIENRARFLFQVIDAVLTAVPSTKVALRLSPFLEIQGATDPDATALFTYVFTQLQSRNLAYIHLTEPTWGAWQTGEPHSQSKLNVFRSLIKAPLMLTGGYTRESATEAIANGRADLIGIGRAFITNPDFVERTRAGHPLTPFADPKGFYSGGAEFYTTWKTWEEEQREKRAGKTGGEIPGAGVPKEVAQL
ncbi:12-oxophytodienoate reductase [Geranomyces variabilis]|nr:12-oxophytodienoate reductase [Geranomyces variabilis]KAJ3141502.1 hypothetical protein HDU90_005839 [Geranomyces variabilis]